MLTTIIIILLALVFFAYVAIPLIFPSQSDKLPDFRDPIKQDLEEERDALFRAIKELDAREDLAKERREQLRARYEAKAAKVLRSLDDRNAELQGQAPPKRAPSRRRTPFAALGLLSIMVIMSTVMTSYVLPRIGNASAVTTFFEGDLELAEQLRDLQRAVRRTPNEETLSTLADFYWNNDEAEQAEETYLRMTQELEPVPVVAYRRLGYLYLQDDIPKALSYLEQGLEVDPFDAETLFALGEVYFSQARPDDAIAAFETLTTLPTETQEQREQVNARLELVRAVAPVLNAATVDPSEDNLLALADAYWEAEEGERAADIYVRIIEMNPHNPVAYSRIGQLLFFSGQNEQAIDVLNRSVEIDDTDLTTLLFLGNAYFSLEQYQPAIDTWEQYVSVAGSEEASGRVPSLIENARARLATAPVIDSASLQEISIQQTYVANCAACHGAQGQGGSGPTLVGNTSAMNENNVSNIIQYGRGLMPGFGARLTEEEIIGLTEYITQDLSQAQ